MKIKKDQLTHELREVVGDKDITFESITDPRDLVDVDIDPEGFYQGRKTVADMLIESREKLDEYGRQLKKIQSQNSEEIN